MGRHVSAAPGVVGADVNGAGETGKGKEQEKKSFGAFHPLSPFQCWGRSSTQIVGDWQVYGQRGKTDKVPPFVLKSKRDKRCWNRGEEAGSTACENANPAPDESDFGETRNKQKEEKKEPHPCKPTWMVPKRRDQVEHQDRCDAVLDQMPRVCCHRSENISLGLDTPLESVETRHSPCRAAPPVRAFWSLALYDADGLQVANVLNPFAVSSWTPFKYSADGSPDRYLQSDSTGKDKEANWLPLL